MMETQCSQMQFEVDSIQSQMEKIHSHIKKEIEKYGKEEINKIRKDITDNKLGGGKIDM